MVSNPVASTWKFAGGWHFSPAYNSSVFAMKDVMP
jgi:hypothetical protein